jgi:hypothetical protein
LGHDVTGFSWSKDQKIEKMKNFGCKIITGDLENFDDVNKAVCWEFLFQTHSNLNLNNQDHRLK